MSEASLEQLLSRLDASGKTEIRSLFTAMAVDLAQNNPDNAAEYLVDFLQDYLHSQRRALSITLEENFPAFTQELNNTPQRPNGLSLSTPLRRDNTRLSPMGLSPLGPDDSPLNRSLPVIPLSPDSKSQLNAQGNRRRGGFSAEPIDVSNFREVQPTRVIPKSEEEKQSIIQAIEHNLLFSELDEKQIGRIVDAMAHVEFKLGDYIIRQGDDGDNFYILAVGQCECFLNQAEGNFLSVQFRR
jgi:hypothetical protein